MPTKSWKGYSIRDSRASGNKSLMSILLNTLLLYPDHPYGFRADLGARL